MESAKVSLLETKSRKWTLTRWQICGIISLVLINVAAIVAYAIVIEQINDRVIDANKVCNEDDPGADRYADPPGQLVYNYFYNISNPLAVVNGSQAELLEVGAYGYTVETTRGNIVYDKSKNTVASDVWYIIINCCNVVQ